MSDQDKKPRSNDSTLFSDEAIRRCLLGVARADEKATFEELLLLNDELEKRTRIAELELADDFSFGRLDAGERELFKRNFLVTTERQRLLAVSQALRTTLLQEAKAAAFAAERKNASQRFQSPALFLLSRPVSRFAVAVLAVLLMGTLGALLLKAPRTKPEVVKREPVPTPERQYAHPVNSQTPAASPTPKPSATVPLKTLVLQINGSVNDHQLELDTAATEQDVIRLELILASHQAAKYKAELTTAAGDQVLVSPELSTTQELEQAKLILDVPAQKLTPGAYRVKLTRLSNNQTFDVGVYSFRIK